MTNQEIRKRLMRKITETEDLIKALDSEVIGRIDGLATGNFEFMENLSDARYTFACGYVLLRHALNRISGEKFIWMEFPKENLEFPDDRLVSGYWGFADKKGWEPINCNHP